MKAPKAKCHNCPLEKSSFVPSEVRNRPVILLAEAPGETEVNQGKPLVGTAGKDLMAILDGMGMSRFDFSLVNTVGCRPTKANGNKITNRTPTMEEIECCNERLKAELDAINPIAVVAMGNTARIALSLGNKNELMKNLVGSEWIFDDKFQVFITYHPATIVHSGGATSEKGRTIVRSIKSSIKEANKVKIKEKQLGFW